MANIWESGKQEMADRVTTAIRSANSPEAAALDVLRAMSAPSPEMLVAAAKLPKTAEPGDVWDAMITAALLKA